MIDLALVPGEELEAAVAWLFRAAGVDAESARLISALVVAANRRGVDSHGVVLVPRYIRGLVAGSLNARPRFTWPVSDDAVAVLDADNAPGHLAAHTAMLGCLDRAGGHGIGLVLVRNTNHFGMAANYARMASERGFIGIATTNGPPVMAPFGGTTPSICNNPIAFAIPRGDRDVVLDMALSVVARGRIRTAALAGQPIPLGWARDKDGVPTTEAQKALEGQLEWIGGYKGYGLGLIIEILAGVLSGAKFGTDVSNQSVNNPTFAAAVPLQHGHFFVAIDVARFFQHREDFQRRLEALIVMIHASDLARDAAEIKLPGEPEWELEKRRAVEGIPVPNNVLTELKAVASELASGGADGSRMPALVRH